MSNGSSESRDQPQAQRTGRLLILAATILWSTSGLFAKAPLIEQLPAAQRGLQLAFWRALFAGVALLPFVRRPTLSWKLLPAVLAFAGMNTSFLLAMTNTTAANAIWLQYVAPLWVFLIGVGLWREKSTRGDWSMLAFSMIGLATILFFELSLAQRTGSNPIGIVWGLAAGIFFAGVILSIRALRDLDSFWVVAVCHLGAAFVLAPLLFSVFGRAANADLEPCMLPSGQLLVWLAIFGIFQMGIPYILFAHGTKQISSHEASFIALLEPMLVPFWVWLAWRNVAAYEAPAWWTCVGGGAILIGLLSKYVLDSEPSKSRGKPE